MEFFETAVQFLKLEKVEIGGLQGKALTNSIGEVFEEFKYLYSNFSCKTYDSLDPEDEGFVSDCDSFNEKVLGTWFGSYMRVQECKEEDCQGKCYLQEINI